MQIVLGILVAAFTVALAVGAISGRVKAKSCCSVAPADQDLRTSDGVEAADA